MVLPRQGSHAQVSQFIHGRRGPVWISRGVSDHQLEWSSDDPAGVIDFTNGQLEAGEQVLAPLDPAGPSQRNESTDADHAGHWIPHHRQQATDYLFADPPGFKKTGSNA
ncbi:hypothetical protein SSP24_14600 [Streptomyces spinoverrucosus]|uniref:Uncharacterized protein n=1 Tax=Streptomyces spinoverrucosus TaxID=284043 RepID=A0A4Y3VBY5_9ACTN|nr:hypothetical protein SSP24_14600 [Streptomyces spinoverrucosus]GHB50056.1 hypothetical protein GCM10010397_20080 [Streptomyces spinoverrucosus]